jgi:hypothetical protein
MSLSVVLHPPVYHQPTAYIEWSVKPKKHIDKRSNKLEITNEKKMMEYSPCLRVRATKLPIFSIAFDAHIDVDVAHKKFRKFIPELR